jgi:hypothetical protein
MKPDYSPAQAPDRGLGTESNQAVSSIRSTTELARLTLGEPSS